jgi:TonB family protein
MNYPADALRNGVEGGVLVKFIVEKDGSISNAEILRSMTESFDTEALRLISHMPNWTPGVCGMTAKVS